MWETIVQCQILSTVGDAVMNHFFRVVVAAAQHRSKSHGRSLHLSLSWTTIAILPLGMACRAPVPATSVAAANKVSATVPCSSSPRSWSSMITVSNRRRRRRSLNYGDVLRLSGRRRPGSSSSPLFSLVCVVFLISPFSPSYVRFRLYSDSLPEFLHACIGVCLVKKVVAWLSNLRWLQALEIVAAWWTLTWCNYSDRSARCRSNDLLCL